MAFHFSVHPLLLVLIQILGSFSSSSLSSPDTFFQRRVLLYGPNNSSGTFGLMGTATTTPTAAGQQPLEEVVAAAAKPRIGAPTLDKLDLRLEAGAKRWQAALNASLGDMTPTTSTTTSTISTPINTTSVEVNHLLQPLPPPSASNLLKANEIAHSEPLKTYGHSHSQHHHHHHHHHQTQNHHHPHHHRTSSSSLSSSAKKKKKVQIPKLDAEETVLDEDSLLDLPPLEFDDDPDLDGPGGGGGLAGSSQAPACATASGKHYCSFKEEGGAAYPAEVVAKIAQYYRYPLQSLFGTALSHQVMPQLANDGPSSGSSGSSSGVGGLVCEATTRLVRVGWAMNTSGRWLAVLNTDHYQQYVTEVLCAQQANSACHYVPPCYQATCTQRYNTQKLLVVDPAVPHRGPFLSEFLFPSCCVCHVRALAGDGAAVKSGSGSKTYSKATSTDQRKKA